MSSFGITPEESPAPQDPAVEPDVETPADTPEPDPLEAETAKPKTMLIEVEVDENNGPLRTTDQTEHLYSYEIDERKKADKTGIYYDDLKLMEAEQQRARVEGREPDYDNMAGIASTPLLRMTERPAEPTS